MIIAVVERDLTIANEDFQDRYIGAPCRSFDEARELCCAHLGRHNDMHVLDTSTMVCITPKPIQKPAKSLRNFSCG